VLDLAAASGGQNGPQQLQVALAPSLSALGAKARDRFGRPDEVCDDHRENARVRHREHFTEAHLIPSQVAASQSTSRARGFSERQQTPVLSYPEDLPSLSHPGLRRVIDRANHGF